MAEELHFLDEEHPTTLANLPASSGADSLKEITELFQASYTLGMLDQYLQTRLVNRAVRAWVLRKEALGVLSTSAGYSSFPSTLAALLVDAEPEVTNNQDHMGLDIHESLVAAWSWAGATPTDSQIRDAWDTSEQSNLRMANPDYQWKLEQTCTQSATALSNLMSTPAPWTAAEAVRQIWMDSQLEAFGRRMSMIAALPLIRSGFGARTATIGVSAELGVDPDQTRQALQAPEDFYPVFYAAVNQSAKKTYEAALKLERLYNEMVSLVPSERSSSKVAIAVEALLCLPVITPLRLAKEIDVTSKGASLILDRLLEARCIAQFPGYSAKNRIYACQKVLAI